MTDQILFRRDGPLGLIQLNRPEALNALSLGMIRAMGTQLAAWAADPAVLAVVVRGHDRAYCAGGDIRVFHDHHDAPDIADTARLFFGLEYRLNQSIFEFPKPFVALIDGITMGGGSGISVHGDFRVATEHTLYAMPETTIGYFPDVGSTWFLPRRPGRTGTWLALTGARIKTADCHYAGIATHVVPRARLEALVGALAARLADRPAPGEAKARIADLLEAWHTDPGPADLATHRTVLDRCFAADTLDAILAALDRAAAGPRPDRARPDSPRPASHRPDSHRPASPRPASPRPDSAAWAATAAAAIRAAAPLSLLVALRQMQTGGDLDFRAAMALEYRVAQRLCRSPDFREGIRAAIVDKDRSPRWHVARYVDIGPEAVEACFAPVTPELNQSPAQSPVT